MLTAYCACYATGAGLMLLGLLVPAIILGVLGLCLAWRREIRWFGHRLTH